MTDFSYRLHRYFTSKATDALHFLPLNDQTMFEYQGTNYEFLMRMVPFGQTLYCQGQVKKEFSEIFFDAFRSISKACVVVDCGLRSRCFLDSAIRMLQDLPEHMRHASDVIDSLNCGSSKIIDITTGKNERAIVRDVVRGLREFADGLEGVLIVPAPVARATVIYPVFGGTRQNAPK